MRMALVLVSAHFVADFLAQSDWMALNKSKRWDALALHVFVYSMVLYGIVPLLSIALGIPAPTGTAVRMMPLFVGANAIAHFVQDAITSRITARLWFIKFLGKSPQYLMFNEAHQEVPVWDCQIGTTRHWFFVAIGFDQLLHYVTLFVTASWLLL